MGREIRKVPANWQHPKTAKWNPRLQKEEEQYEPLYDDRESALKEFAEAIDYHGGGPTSHTYVDFEEQEPTWWQVYETVSEGTPVTPPFATREELVEYLVENGDFWDQHRAKGSIGGFRMPCGPWSRNAAESFVMGAGWAPSLVVDGGKVMSGAEFLGANTEMDNGEHNADDLT